ncbi:adenosine deaminase AGSA-like [Liolophura sinensis]|uniref:adenosine deaminase AGSA-like n=1 Tax=Liolophura sinensis TaxID=3198878 RepID=UPI0031599562
MWLIRLYLFLIYIQLTYCKAVPKSLTKEEFLAERKEAHWHEQVISAGGDIHLSPKEQYVDKLLLDLKAADFEDARLGKKPFLPSLHFFEAKPLIDNSSIFHIIKDIPKGAVLHIHDTAMVSLDWVVKNVTYRDNLYMCVPANNNERVEYLFADRLPNATDQCSWELVRNRRENSTDVEEFDEWLKRQMSLLRDDLASTNPTQDDIWKQFTSCFSVMNGMVYYPPVVRDYFRRALQEFHDDNVQYIEVRILLKETYNLDGTKNDFLYLLEMYRNVSEEFKRDNPTSSGAKVIITGIRNFNNSVIRTLIKQVTQFRQRFPDFIVGFDLVSQEDRGKPLLYYLDELIAPNAHDPSTLPYIFHAGETVWQGTVVDENIIDAILLGTKRLGHGFAISKHPWGLEEVKKRDIAIEVNPISNQVLGLVKDLRNHPVSFLLAQNYPIVISPDDPPMWGAKGLSYDFFEAFMGLTGAKTGLAFLKKMARNSLEYSSLSTEEKKMALDVWEVKWNTFIDNTVGNVTINVTEPASTSNPTNRNGTNDSATFGLHRTLIFLICLLSLNMWSSFVQKPC